MKLIPLLLVILLTPSAFAETELPVISVTTFEGITPGLVLTNIHANFNEDKTILITGEIVNHLIDTEFENFQIQAAYSTDRRNENIISNDFIAVSELVTFDSILEWSYTTSSLPNVLGIEFHTTGFSPIETGEPTPTASVTLEDSATGKMVNLIGDDFGASKELIITVTNPDGIIIQDLIQHTTNAGRINVLFLLDENPLEGIYILHLTNHSYELTLDILYEGEAELEIIESTLVGDPTLTISPTITEAIDTIAESTDPETSLNSTERALILAVLHSVVDLIEGLITALE